MVAPMEVADHVVAVRGHGLTPPQVVAVARDDAKVELADEGRAAMQASADVVARLVDADEPAYGVSTGFGSLANVVIPAERRAELQRALVRSHAAGMGPPVEREVVRAMMLLRARTLAMGFSGARPVVGERILDLLNAGITPVVREHGSLGASGDLAPLAHCALALLGEGEAQDAEGRVRPAADLLAEAGLEPLELLAKEGLALINGTDGMLGMLLLAIDDLDNLLKVADITAAMSVEGLMGTDRAFAEDLIALRPQPGQAASAANLRALLAGSPIVASHRWGDDRVQDAYSLRCAPQVAGAARDTLEHARRVAAAELESAIDNPMVLPDGRVESCGNFHGAPVGYACDFLAVAAADVGAIAERRTDRLLDPARSHGLPPFLTEDAGVNSGLMIAQYTQAAMVAENRRAAVPASADTLPSSAMQEDHVSMGWGAARKLRGSVRALARVLAVELVAAARGIDLRAPLEPGAGTAAALHAVRERIPGPGPDRWLAPDLGAAEELVTSGALVGAVEARLGALRRRARAPSARRTAPSSRARGGRRRPPCAC
jgi:histidine ammonia-lyase